MLRLVMIVRKANNIKKRGYTKTSNMTNYKAMIFVVRQLHKAGYQALLAGGCVRDKLLGKRPKDYDVATNALPESVISLFNRTITVGAQFGVVMVLVGKYQIEVATFRSDFSYEDGRRPQRVVYTDARQDAARRDFTINGMFYDPLSRQVIDYVNGRVDIDRGIIRAIGNPDQRFAEDHLRMLRAVRFAGRFGFTIEPRTWQAIINNACKLRKISSERIARELELMLTDKNRSRALQLAYDSGLLHIVLPGMGKGQLLKGLTTLGQLKGNISARQQGCLAMVLAGLLIDCGGRDDVIRICRHLKLSNRLQSDTVWLVEGCHKLIACPPASKSELKLWLAKPLFGWLLRLCRCYLKASGSSLAVLYMINRAIKQLGDEPVSPRPLLNGNDIIKLGIAAGPEVGMVLKQLYIAQLENDIKNKTQARQWVRHYIKKKLST